MHPTCRWLGASSFDERSIDVVCSQSPDGKEIAFCRAATGEAPAIWVRDNEGKNTRELTRGIENGGADHPRWLG